MSGEVEASQAELDMKALEGFLVGNRDLKRLEAFLDRFNLFEATGFVRQELRHSDFLAFLLDPKGNHELGGAFIERLLRRVLALDGDTPVPLTSTELGRWDLDRVEVRREWQYVDILLVNEDDKFAVIIENKIDSDERPGQLQRYLDVVGQHFSGFRVVPVYLTRLGVAPLHGSYLPVDYGLIWEVIDSITEDPRLVVGSDLKTVLKHYNALLRRHILSDSDVARQCRQIYKDHKKALDLIFYHRPDPQEDVGNLLRRLIDGDRRVTYERGSRKPYIYFRPSGWVAGSHGPLYFVFHNHPSSLDLYIEVSGAEVGTRKRLFDVARRNGSLFKDFMENPGSGLNPKLYRRTFLTPEFYEDASDTDREEEISRQWSEFLDVDLPKIDAALKGERSIWESDEGHSGRGGRFGWGDGDIEITRRPDEHQE